MAPIPNSVENLYDLLSLPTSGQHSDASAPKTVANGADKNMTPPDDDTHGILGFNPYDPKSVLAATPQSGNLAVDAKSNSLDFLTSLLPSDPLKALPSIAYPSLGSATLGKQGY